MEKNRSIGKCFLLVVIILSLSGLSAETIKINEKYCSYPNRALFPKGKIGNALWLRNNPAIKYPVPFRKKEVSEGTVSFWIKPMKIIKMAYDSQYLNISGIFKLHTWCAGRGGDGKRRFSFTGYSSYPEQEFYEKFHHILYTWNDDGEKSYLDGKCVYDKKVDKKTSKDGSNTTLNTRFANGALLDELIILNRMVTSDEIKRLSEGKSVWKMDDNTVFYASCDKTVNAVGNVKDDGDLIRMYCHVGKVDATFLAGEKAEFDFKILNSTKQEKKLILKGVIKNLDKKVVLEKEIPVEAGSGKITSVNFIMNEIKTNGLFWGYFSLLDNGKEIQKEMIPFAKTLGIDAKDCTPKEMTTGFVRAYCNNPPCYQKWAIIQEGGWSYLEPEPGKWYFEQLDYWIDSLIKNGNMPILYVRHSPAWFKKRFPKNGGLTGYYVPDADNPEAMKIWKNYIKTVAERYKGKVYDYEFFAEGYGWSKPVNFAKLFNITADTLHSVDPKINLACTLGGYDSWASTVTKMVAKTAGYYTPHPYGFVSGENPENLRDESKYERYKKMIRKYGGREKFAVTEYGCWTALSYAVDREGYPLTKAQFDAAVKKTKMPHWFTKRGRGAFVDFYTGAARVVRGQVLSLAAGCIYSTWWSSVGGGMIADLQFKAHTPSLESMAYANVSGLLSGYKFVKRVDLGASYLYGYLFQKDDTYQLVAFTEMHPAVIFPEISGKNIEVLNHYANKEPFKSAGTAIRIDLKPLTPVFIRNITRVSPDLKPVIKAKLVEKSVYPGTVCKILTPIFNPLNKEIEGKVKLVLPKTFKKPTPVKVKLKPHEYKKITFDIPIPVKVIYKQTMEVVFSSTDQSIGTLKYLKILPIRNSTIAKFTSKPVKIDGKLDEWGDPEKFQVSINDGEQVIRGIPFTKLYMMDQHCDWKSIKDLSAKVAVKYDKDNIYFAVKTLDDKIMNFTVDAPIYIYEGDGIELFFDGRGKEQGSPVFLGDVYHIKMAPRQGKEQPPFHHVSKPKKGKEIPGFEYESQVLPDGYTLEIKIPWKNFPEIKPEKGLKLGMAMHLNDQDKKKKLSHWKGCGAKTTMLWGGEKGASANPSKFGTIILE